MDELDSLAAQFEASRSRLRGLAYRMLGSLHEADDAVQESWLRLSGTQTDRIENLSGWLTTVVARICLNMLRSRKSRGEEPFDVHVPDPVVSRADGNNPEQAALVAESVALALLVILETLGPDERLAFVLHDLFAMPFGEIALILGRSSDAARQLASRARRRVQGSVPVPDADQARQREVVDAFLAAARAGDFGALLTLLDPDIVLRADRGDVVPGASTVIRGAKAVAEGALTFSRLAAFAGVALVNGAPGILSRFPDGRPQSIVAFTIRGGKIVQLNILANPARLRELDLPVLDH